MALIIENSADGFDRTYWLEYLDHYFPIRMLLGERAMAFVSIRNKGNWQWLRHDPNGHPVDLAIWEGDRILATHPLPQNAVNPDDQVIFHFPFEAPAQPGLHKLTIGLVHQNVILFSDKDVPSLQISMEVGLREPMQGEGSCDLVFAVQEKARISPWYYRPSGGIQRTRDGIAMPEFTSRASGAYLWDVQGRRYLDYVMGWGSAVLGYAEPRIQDALRQALGTGVLTPFPYAVEMEVATNVVDDFPCAEMVVFGKNGSDACTVAARLARAYTRKNVILHCGYHGWQDFWVEQVGMEWTGVPDRAESLIHGFRFNDQEHFKNLFNIHRDNLAAIMLEPSGPGQSIQGNFQEPDIGFLALLSSSAKESGSLLIYDEIMTGYRHRHGSAQKATGVIPDLVCLGKALGGGMPLSALAGRAEIMQGAMARTHYGPTFKGEYLSFISANVAQRIFREESVAEYIHGYGTCLRDGLNEILHANGYPASCMGPPWRMSIVFDEVDPHRLRMIRTYYQQELLKEGIVTYHGIFLPSYAHHQDDLVRTLETADRVFRKIFKDTDLDQLERALEIPLLPDR